MEREEIGMLGGLEIARELMGEGEGEIEDDGVGRRRVADR